MHYDELNKLLDSLADAVANEHPQKGYWRELWGLVSRIRSGIKETRYPTAEEKQRAIERLNELVEAARRRSEEEKRRRAKIQCEWEQKIARSDRAKQDVEKKLGGTRPATDIERMIASVILAPLELLENALRSLLGLGQLDEVHEDLKICSANMKDAWRLFREREHDLLPGDKNELYRQLKDAQERLNAAWNRWKSVKNQAYEERCRAREARQRERDERHRSFVARVEANIEKLEAKIAQAEDALERQRDHLSDLQQRYRESWNDDFRERCRQWIEEAEERIRSIENSIRQWREWLDKEHDKLRR
jgi:predicted ribosome quality control (RQC) complex YloA/Tae2 family protein